jgi:hypothetical protein
MGGESGEQNDLILQILVIGFIIVLMVTPFVAFAALILALAR